MKDATLTTAQAAAISLKLARAFHWLCYDERRQAEILRRVERSVTELERLRTILEMLDRIGEMFDEALLDDWRRRRVEEAIITCRSAAEYELSIIERQRVKALHPTYEAHL